MTILTIDGGTTNTRLYRMLDGEILDVTKLSIGIRDTLTPAGRNAYIAALTEEIARAAGKNPAPEAIVCAGMIGSATGLALCPHVRAPITFDELAGRLMPVSLPEVSPLPIWFVPGLKTYDDTVELPLSMDALAGMDIMRGEEAEICGILTRLGLGGERTVLLPGSHMKYVSVDGAGRVTGFRTALTGELLRSLTEHTILRSSLDGVYPKSVDTTGLRDGAALVRKLGVTGALFKVRVYDMAAAPEKDTLFSVLLGILLLEDVDRLCRLGTPVTVAGSEPFRGAYTTLLQDGGLTVDVVPAEVADAAAAYGMAWLFDRFSKM